jgi:hypothetical protein
MAKCMRGQANKNPKNRTELRDTLNTKIATAARVIPIKHIFSKLFIIIYSVRNRLLRKYEGI